MQVKEIIKSGKAGTTVVVNQDESIDNAALLMKEHKLAQISVADNNGKIIGVINKDSILQASDDLNEDFFLN
jgi:predicted transcriptional regulator